MNENGNYGNPVRVYVDTNVSAKFVKIIQLYVGVVDRFMWRKDMETVVNG